MFMQDPEGFNLVKLHSSESSEHERTLGSLSTKRQKAVYAMCEQRINQFLDKIRAEGGDELSDEVSEQQGGKESGFHVTPNGVSTVVTHKLGRKKS